MEVPWDDPEAIGFFWLWMSPWMNKPAVELLNIAGSIEVITSSTAQGGGGSFKDSKPIGEVGCCESRMAERIH